MSPQFVTVWSIFVHKVQMGPSFVDFFKISPGRKLVPGKRVDVMQSNNFYYQID
jgi:hypothetical protein